MSEFLFSDPPGNFHLQPAGHWSLTLVNAIRHADGDRRRLHLVFLTLLLAVGTFTPSLVRAQAKKPHPVRDESCLACHGQAGVTSPSGQSISIDPDKHAVSVHGILACAECHTTNREYPHPNKVVKVRCLTCHADEASRVSGSIHSALGERACLSCHGDPDEVTEATQIAPAKCAQCQSDEVKGSGQSIHGQAAAAGDPDAPKCTSCHGPVHQIQSAGEAAIETRPAFTRLPASPAASAPG